MKQQSIKRRKFLKNSLLIASAATTGLGLNSCIIPEKEAKNININLGKTYKWKAVTTWPTNFSCFR